MIAAIIYYSIGLFVMGWALCDEDDPPEFAGVLLGAAIWPIPTLLQLGDFCGKWWRETYGG